MEDRIEAGTLGDYALGFGHGYFIHGTLYTRLLGRNVTHGCVRVGDEDLKDVFKAVPIGREDLHLLKRRTMKKTAAMAVIAAAGLAGLGGAAGPDKAALAKKTGRSSAEYSLAKDAKFYFVFDVLGRKLELRVRGMVLRTWPLQAMRFWGRPDFAGTVELVEKTTLKAPERIVIKPGETEEPIRAGARGQAGRRPGAATADYDLEALELRDMPKRFSLDFDNGLHVTVKAKDGGSAGLIGIDEGSLALVRRLPLRHLFGATGGKALSELELDLRGREGRPIHLLAFLRRDQGHYPLEHPDNKRLEDN